MKIENDKIMKIEAGGIPLYNLTINQPFQTLVLLQIFGKGL